MPMIEPISIDEAVRQVTTSLGGLVLQTVEIVNRAIRELPADSGVHASIGIWHEMQAQVEVARIQLMRPVGVGFIKPFQFYTKPLIGISWEVTEIYTPEEFLVTPFFVDLWNPRTNEFVALPRQLDEESVIDCVRMAGGTILTEGHSFREQAQVSHMVEINGHGYLRERLTDLQNGNDLATQRAKWTRLKEILPVLYRLGRVQNSLVETLR